MALTNTRIMVHHPSGAARGQASDINREARELLRIRDYMDNILAEATGQPFDKVRAGRGVRAWCGGRCCLAASSSLECKSIAVVPQPTPKMPPTPHRRGAGSPRLQPQQVL